MRGRFRCPQGLGGLDSPKECSWSCCRRFLDGIQIDSPVLYIFWISCWDPVTKEVHTALTPLICMSNKPNFEQMKKKNSWLKTSRVGNISCSTIWKICHSEAHTSFSCVSLHFLFSKLRALKSSEVECWVGLTLMITSVPALRSRWFILTLK